MTDVEEFCHGEAERCAHHGEQRDTYARRFALEAAASFGDRRRILARMTEDSVAGATYWHGRAAAAVLAWLLSAVVLVGCSAARPTTPACAGAAVNHCVHGDVACAETTCATSCAHATYVPTADVEACNGAACAADAGACWYLQP